MFFELLANITVEEMSLALAKRIRELRLRKNFKRQTLAERAGVSVTSLKRFELTGQISLTHLLQLVHALGRLPEFEGLLKPPEAKSIEELEQRAVLGVPQRGRQ